MHLRNSIHYFFYNKKGTFTRFFCSIYSSSRTKIGANTMSNDTKMRLIRYGMLTFIIFSIDNPFILLVMNRFKSTLHGIILPIAILSKNRTPKCRVEIPSNVSNERGTGVMEPVSLSSVHHYFILYT